MKTWFQPRLFVCLRDYKAATFTSDLAAGITVGIVALPLAMAFGIASGVTPAAGLFTAIVAGFIISTLGGSSVQIGGPTGAFVVIVGGIVARYGLANLTVCTIMAGVILILIGVARMGAIIRYIPRPVTVGFTNGIAVLIAITQIKDAFGIRLNQVPSEFFKKISALAEHAATWNPAASLLTFSSLALIIVWPKAWARRAPAYIVVVVLGSLVAWYFHLSVATIDTQFGGIPRQLPSLQLPVFHLSELSNLVAPAFTIALLAAIESLLSATVADGMIDERHDSNTELIAQGVANLASPLFGGLPATGAIARTATNIRSGAKTPVSGIIHAVTLLLILLTAAPLARYIPLASLSAILLMVAYNMGEWQEFHLIRRMPASDTLVLLATFTLTVTVDLTVAVGVGMVLASMLFIRRVSQMTQVSLVDEQSETEGEHHSLRGKTIPPGVLIFRIFGVLMFGAADKLENILIHARDEPQVIILRMRKVLAMDSTALEALERLYEKVRRRGKHIILSGPHTQPLVLMENSGFLERLGRDNIVANIDEALNRARQILLKPDVAIAG